VEIGVLQSQELAVINSLLKDLSDVIDTEHRTNVRNIQNKLDNWAANVAVIGQVKAGKSTFLNSFLHMDDFLPSDVNPWTSVVTNIRINLKNDPRSGASFEFFDEADWIEIMDGNSEVRKLAEELLPGFETGVLRQQVEHMRNVAKKRLGDHYHMLLGQSHEYDFLNADLMERYVCAGENNDTPGDNQGKYATITKVANAFMRRPEFKVPVILTDTPGVNDPFLVRDEFTCRSLDKSDIFVVVLSAHQALTDVDVALIRLLAKQDEKDVIIYINRIDELDSFATEVPQITADVTARLRKAVPDLEFTVLAGSAFMAEIASKSGAEAEEIRAELDNEDLRNYLQDTLGYVPEDQTDRLYAGAGIDVVKKAISTAIDSGIGAQKLDQIYQEARAEVGAMLFSIKREHESVHRQIQNVATQSNEEVIADLERELESLKDLQVKLDQLLEEGNQSIEKLVDKSWMRLQNDLNKCVVDFVDSQKQLIEEAAFKSEASGNSKKEVRVGLAALHDSFETMISSHFRKARTATDASLSDCLGNCQDVMQSNFADLVEGVTLDDLPHDEFVSTLTFSKKDLTLPIVKERGWAFWRKAKVNRASTLKALKEIAAAEFKPVVEKMTRALNEVLVERSTDGTDRIRVLIRTTDTAINERGRRIRRDRRQIERAGTDTSANQQLVGRLQTQIDILDRRIQNLSVIESSLYKAAFLKAA